MTPLHLTAHHSEITERMSNKKEESKMQDTIYDSKTGLTYKLEGDYYIPLVELTEPPGGSRPHHYRNV